MKFETERLIFRSIEESDFDDVIELYSLPEISLHSSFDSDRDITENINELNSVYEESLKLTPKEFCFILIGKDTNKIIGIIGLIVYSYYYKVGSMYCFLKPEYWNQRFGKEAVLKMISFSFNNIKLHRIELGINVNNKNAILLAESVGFKKEGRKRSNIPCNATWDDSFIYSILETEI